MLFRFNFFQAKNDTCIWYGEHEKKSDLPLNRYYNGIAKPLTDSKSINILKTWCPDFVEEYSDGKCIFWDKSYLRTLSFFTLKTDVKPFFFLN